MKYAIIIPDGEAHEDVGIEADFHRRAIPLMPLFEPASAMTSFISSIESGLPFPFPFSIPLSSCQEPVP